MLSIIKVIKEQFDNFLLIRRLSNYELKSNNRDNYLGSFWEFINPLIQIFIYWFVFANIRQRSGIELSNGETVPYVYWMLIGFVIWTFFYKATIEGSKSIYTRINMLSRMNFPMSVIPNIPVFTNLIIHIVLIAISMDILNLAGFYVSIYYLQLLYFIPAMVIFLFSIALITSTISTIIRDFHMLINSFLRMFLYLSPVLWEIGNMSGKIGILVKLNPLFYLIEGYRAALFGTEWYFIEHSEYTLYFWFVTILMLVIGSMLHVKFRRRFVDFL